ncbi:hypothetical protein A9Q86_08200 [Flavobacteriales bacterium 33_180_T64]|nr:hypothetical protein A9Q86_08200 [Flavobacteriales bacterium 33_180_T64]
MKKLILLVLLISTSVVAQQEIDYSKHVTTVDSTIEALYSVISGDKGEARDWDKFRYLFHENAKLIPTRKTKDSKYVVTYMTPDDYIERAGKWLVENGFHEVEISRSTQTFGNITQVFSTYESYKSKSDTEPFMRGINSIQLLNDGRRWWIINIYWQQETDEHPIPEVYLPKN